MSLHHRRGQETGADLEEGEVRRGRLRVGRSVREGDRPRIGCAGRAPQSETLKPPVCERTISWKIWSIDTAASSRTCGSVSLRAATSAAPIAIHWEVATRTLSAP